MLTAPVMKDVLILYQRTSRSNKGQTSIERRKEKEKKETHSNKPTTALDVQNRQGNTGSTALSLLSCLPLARHEFAKNATQSTAEAISGPNTVAPLQLRCEAASSRPATSSAIAASIKKPPVKSMPRNLRAKLRFCFGCGMARPWWGKSGGVARRRSAAATMAKGTLSGRLSAAILFAE
jgi:hypothetical protein